MRVRRCRQHGDGGLVFSQAVLALFACLVDPLDHAWSRDVISAILQLVVDVL